MIMNFDLKPLDFPSASRLKTDALIVLVPVFTASFTLTPDLTEYSNLFGPFTPKIGYPTKWRDYSDFHVVKGDMIAAAAPKIVDMVESHMPAEMPLARRSPARWWPRYRAARE